VPNFGATLIAKVFATEINANTMYLLNDRRTVPPVVSTELATDSVSNVVRHLADLQLPVDVKVVHARNLPMGTAIACS